MEHKISLIKGKGIYITDILLSIVFIPVIGSGVCLHLTTHERNPLGLNGGAWSGAHLFFCLIFTILLSFHIKSHQSWFRSLLKGKIKNRGKLPILVFLLFLFSLLSGIHSLFPNQMTGLIHYKLSLVMLTFTLIHISKRMPVVVKAYSVKGNKTIR